MTRYARMKRDRKMQEANSTPWSILSKGTKQCTSTDPENANDGSVQEVVETVHVDVDNPKHTGTDSSNNGQPTDNSENLIVREKRKKKKRKIQEIKVVKDERTVGDDEKNDEQSGDDHLENVPSTAKKGKWTEANTVMSFQELSEYTEFLFSVTDLDEVKQRVRRLWKSGQLDKSQAAKLIRKWRSRQWQEKQKQNREALVNNLSARLDSAEEQTLDDVRRLVNEYVASRKIAYEDGALLIRKWKKRESRRVKRQLDKGNKSCCFYCRQTGHKFSECPEKDDRMMGSGICFKCGSTEHTSSRCPRKNVRGFPYATCFVCKQQGHLSRDCDKNANGIYPDGGSCNLCGSQKHLKKDCPLRKAGNDQIRKVPLVATGSNTAGGDDDVLLYGSESGTDRNSAKKRKLERKIVRI